jgi:hypothetical protein
MTVTAEPVEFDMLPLRERRRRYEERNGNGTHAPAEDVEDDGDDTNVAACSVCGSPVDTPRAKTCRRPECVTEARKRRRRANNQRRANGEKPPARTVSRQTSAVTATPAAPNGATVDTTGPVSTQIANGVGDFGRSPVDVVAFAEAFFAAYGPGCELELTTPAVVVLCHPPRGRT